MGLVQESQNWFISFDVKTLSIGNYYKFSAWCDFLRPDDSVTKWPIGIGQCFRSWYSILTINGPVLKRNFGWCVEVRWDETISSFPQNLKPKNNNKGSSYFSSCSMNIDNGFQFIICASSIINCEPGINCDLSISSRLSEEILFIKFCNTNIHLLPICTFFYASLKEDLECGTLESRGFCKL